MITLSELNVFLKTYLTVEDFEDYCPNGIQIEGKERIRKIAVAVSSDLRTIEEAVSHKVDALIVHHGLFWNKDTAGLRIEGKRKRKLQLLLNHDISLLAYHIPLDAHRECGNNWRAAHDLGWKDLEPFGLYGKKFIGVKGRFPATKIDDFISKLEHYYSHAAFTALGGKETVSSAALISGGAYRELSSAAKEGVECFITGNFDEPAWSIAHEEGIHFLALGHSATERVGPKALGEKLQNVFGVEVVFLDIPNPF